jgi:DNA repair protein RecO (recombination protein O)
MAAEKNRAIVLRVLPYRESSLIIHLFSESHGLLHGIAKGIRRGKGAVALERGMLVELVAYVKPHRELHTLGSVAVLEFFPAIRSDLIKTALRDAAFELALRTITLSDPHPEIFDCFGGFLRELETAAHARCFPFALWKFYLSFAALLGFELNSTRCLECGNGFAEGMEGILRPARGGFVCVNCHGGHGGGGFPARAMVFMNAPDADPPQLETADLKRITRGLAAFCAYHFDIRHELLSLGFLDELY